MGSPLARGDAAPSLLTAFPDRLAGHLRAVVDVMPPARIPPSSPFRVVVDGESVTIPYRIYNDEPPDPVVLGAMPSEQRAILNCLYTRHHDGRVRQQRLAQIVESTESWIVPFVVQLVGEYVLEILLDLRRELVELDTPGTRQHTAYGRFLANNPSFLALTGQRVASYWACYYRSLYSDRRYYPGYTLLDSLRAAARHHRNAHGAGVDLTLLGRAR